MRILYLDTSSSYLYAALYEDGAVVEEIKEKLDAELSVKALPLLTDLFTKSNIDPFSINKIILVNGPGSFTGIRIGVTIAKVYAWSKDISITTISSLEAMALSSIEDTDYIVPLIDARRGNVYTGIYTKDNEKILDDQYTSLSALLVATSSLGGTISYISNDMFETMSPIEPYIPNITKIINIHKEKEPINPHEIDANYLKKTEAEEKKDQNDKGNN
jgi:universal bacterial protein YeaZ